MSVALKHSWKKPNSSLLYFRLHVPDDIKPLLIAAGSRMPGSPSMWSP
jgi:hypothetical protein